MLGYTWRFEAKYRNNISERMQQAMSATEAGAKTIALALATVGRIVHYVMETGRVRPMMVVEDFGAGHTVNGVVFLDVANDPPVDVHDGSGVKSVLMPVSSASYSPGGEPGTWHWPTRVQHAEASAAITAEHVEAMFARFRDSINAKLDVHLEAVGKIADGVSAEFQQHVENLGFRVAVEADKLLHRPPAQVGGLGSEQPEVAQGGVPTDAAAEQSAPAKASSDA